MTDSHNNGIDVESRILQSNESEQDDDPIPNSNHYNTGRDDRELSKRDLEKSSSKIKPTQHEDNHNDDSVEKNSLKMLTKKEAKNIGKKGKNKISPETEADENQDKNNPLKKKITYLNITTNELRERGISN